MSNWSWAEKYPSLPPLPKWASRYRMADYARAKIWMFKITGAYPDISVVEGRINAIKRSGGWMNPKAYNYKVNIRITQWQKTYSGLNTLYGAINYTGFRTGKFVRNALASELLFRLSGCGIKVWPYGTYRTAWEQSRANTRKMALARMSGTGTVDPVITFEPSLWAEPAAVDPVEIAPAAKRRRFFTEQE